MVSCYAKIMIIQWKVFTFFGVNNKNWYIDIKKGRGRIAGVPLFCVILHKTNALSVWKKFRIFLESVICEHARKMGFEYINIIGGLNNEQKT